MDENEKDLNQEEFDLEDILREFGGEDPADAKTEETPEEVPEEIQQEVAEETPAESEEAPAESAEEAPAEETPAAEPAEQEPEIQEESVPDAPQAPEQTDDMMKRPTTTIPVAEVQEKMQEDTIRMEPVGEETDDGQDISHTRSFEPVKENEDVKPFSEEWEPEYEQPIGEYVPPQPIVFRPHSRLQELKRKLVNGPEKRYYALTEMGVGKIQAVIFLNLLVVLLSAGATVLYAMGIVTERRMRLMVFGQFFAMLISALLGSSQLVDGISDLFHKRFTLNTMLAFTFIACVADGIMGLRELRVPCCAAFSLEMTMSLWSSFERRNTEMGQMDTLRKAVRLDGLVNVPDYYQGKTGYLRNEGQVEDFMDHYSATSKPEDTINTYSLIAFLLSIGIAAIAGGLHGLSFGVQVLAVTMLAAVPATSFIAVSRPMAILERKLHRLGSVICGWRGVKGLCGKAVFPLQHEDLFPGGATSMNGVKFYSDRDPDETVAYATALIDANGSGLAPLFDQLLESRNCRHYDVENLQCYGEGGIGGEINGEPVLVGVLSFMKDMGVEIPEGTRVNQAVYTAVDGELCGLFAISYEKDRSAIAGVSALCGSKGLTPVLISGDFMLTASFIRGRFGTATKKMGYPEHEERAELAAVQPPEDAEALALMTEEGLAPAACAVTGARAFRTAAVAGVMIHLIGGLVGLAMMVILAFLGSAELMTPANMFLYQLIWMIPGLLVTEWARTA